MPPSSLSPWTRLPSQHKSLKRSAVAPIDRSSCTTDEKMPDASGDEPRLIVSLKLPAKYWRDERAPDIHVSKNLDHDEGAGLTKRRSNAAQVYRDVEVLNGSIGSQRQKLGRIHLSISV